VNFHKWILNQDEYIYQTQVIKQHNLQFYGDSMFNLDNGYKTILGKNIRHSLCTPADRWGTWTRMYYLYGALENGLVVSKMDDALFSTNIDLIL